MQNLICSFLLLAQKKRTKEKGNLKNVNLFPKKIWWHYSPNGDLG
jgi:hypothetical protein